MDSRLKNPPYTYTQAGFNGFSRRSIDSTSATNLRQATSNFRKVNNQSLNFDNLQTTGSLGSVFRIGAIHLDGNKARISMYDAEGNEFFAAGELSD